MQIIEKILLGSHVLAGVVVLITGILAAFIGRKGGKLHRKAGKVFVWAMFWIFVSALLIVSIIRFSFFLTVIAVFSFYMAFSGYRVLTIRKTMKVTRLDWFAAITTCLLGVSLTGIGFVYLYTDGLQSALGYLSLFFGFFTAQTGWVNYKGFRNLANAEKMWWWFAHMNSMGGSFIASITAFLVQNGRIFNMPSEWDWSLWLLPAMIGIPLISYWSSKYRKQFKAGLV